MNGQCSRSFTCMPNCSPTFGAPQYRRKKMKCSVLRQKKNAGASLVLKLSGTCENPLEKYRS